MMGQPLEQRSKIFATTVLVVVTLSLLVPWLMRWRPIDSVQETSAFVDVIQAQRASLRPGDRILVHPPWRHDVLQAVDAANVLPAGVEVTTALSRRHGEKPRNVWLLWDPAVPLPRSLRRDVRTPSVQGAGGLAWTHLGAAGERAVRPLDERLADAQVFVEDASGKRTDCAYQASANRHICRGLPDWMYVGPTTLTIEGKSERCMWNHPISKGRVVTRLEEVTPEEIHGISYGFADGAVQNGGAPVTVTVRVAGREIHKRVHENRTGFHSTSLRVEPNEDRHDVEIEVTTQNDGARHFCWRIEAGGTK